MASSLTAVDGAVRNCRYQDLFETALDMYPEMELGAECVFNHFLKMITEADRNVNSTCGSW